MQINSSLVSIQACGAIEYFSPVALISNACHWERIIEINKIGIFWQMEYCILVTILSRTLKVY